MFPTIAIVAAVVVLPLLAIFWISFKPIGLADLRPPAPVAREALRGSGEEMRVEYRVRNSSQSEVIRAVTLSRAEKTATLLDRRWASAACGATSRRSGTGTSRRCCTSHGPGG